ncbi:hypothetical protein EVAR_49756_1 [Eumeta japonica]|uniref:Uncharacterized protein n=1 Tax=Eumeta variegata TaxID=151549 RepID=A0A4C1YCS9_EUMVA|nr:hypothetical protein EVAR_49756_1 [Eumeta japonica]
MSDFQGLMMEPEGSDDGVRRLVALFHYEVLASTFRFHHQTLETNHGKSAFQDNSNNRKYRLDMLSYYRVLVLTFQLHHQTLKIVHGQSTSQDDFYKTKHG